MDAGGDFGGFDGDDGDDGDNGDDDDMGGEGPSLFSRVCVSKFFAELFLC